MQESKEQQLFFMRWAIQLAEKGRCTTFPNPWVGCLLVKEGAIIAEGYHACAGQCHAEVIALEKAGDLARGATAYVTLEPCAHFGKTPPCAEALIKAGIKKVIIPFLDPNPKVAGKGVEILRAHGIEVIVGIGKEEAETSLSPYLHRHRTGLPLCLLKSAISLDGKIAASDGSSKWITDQQARHDAHRLRAESQAILIGSQTALLDNPRLTVRGIEIAKQPLRVILDRRGRLAPNGHLADQELAPTLLFTSTPNHVQEWEKRGAEVHFKENWTLKEILEELGRRKIMQLLVEGGGHLHRAFLNNQLADRFILYLGACLLGEQGHPLLPNLLVSTMASAPRWKLEKVYHFGNDLRLDYKIFETPANLEK